MVVQKVKAYLEGVAIPKKHELWSKSVEAMVDSTRHGKAVKDQKAVICGDRTYTFGELNGLANRLARALVNRIREHNPELKPCDEHVICTFGETSDTHIIEWLAINKAGVGIMSLTPSATGERVQQLLEGSHPLCVLVDKNYEVEFKKKNLDISGQLVLYFQDLIKQGDDKAVANMEDSERIQVPGPEGVFFLTTTTGTTGTPKLVPVRNSLFYNCCVWLMSRTDPDDDCVFLTQSVITTNWVETALPLMTGCPQVVLIGAQNKNPEIVTNIINEHKVTHILFLSPSFVANLLIYLQMENNPRNCKTIKFVECNAETLPYKTAKEFYEYFPDGTLLFNGWGMVETCDSCVILQRFEKAADLETGSYHGNLSIGVPTPNTDVYITDDNLKLLNQGERGNLCVSGGSIFRGYLHRETETIKKNPFTQKPDHETLFITGDYARIVNNMVIFEGRQIHHVKIRGFRLHTGEVEACIGKHLPGIQATCVRGIESKGSQIELVCFYAPKPGESITENDIISACKEHLEEYKVPMYVHRLEKIPVEPPNNKINEKLLKEIHLDWKRGNMPVEVIKERNLDPTTDALFTTVSDAFGISKFALYEDSQLRSIGGTSINIVWVWSKLKAQGFDLKMTDILASKNLSDILSLMKSNQGVQSNNKEDQTDGDQYEVVDLFQQKDAKDTLSLVARNFVERSDVTIRAGVDYDTYMRMLDEFWPMFEKSNFSSALRDKKTGKILAVNLYSADKDEQDFDVFAVVEKIPSILPFAIIVGMVETPMKKLLHELPPETLNGWFLGVDQDLDAEETLKVMKMLDESDWKRAKQEGYKRICGTALHPVTKATMEDLGYVTVHEIRTRDVVVNGVKLYEDYSEDHVISAQFMSLYDPKEHELVLNALKEGKTSFK